MGAAFKAKKTFFFAALCIITSGICPAETSFSDGNKAFINKPYIDRVHTIKIEGPLPSSSYEELRNAERISNWTAIYIAMLLSERAGPAAAPYETYRNAIDSGWFDENVRIEAFQHYDDLALLIMGIFNGKGGLMWNARKHKSKHYAYKELVYNGIFESSLNPDGEVSGVNLFYLMQKAEDYYNPIWIYDPIYETIDYGSEEDENAKKKDKKKK